MKKLEFHELKNKLKTTEVNLVEVMTMEGIHDSKEEQDVNIPLEEAGKEALGQFSREDPIVVYGSLQDIPSCERMAHKLEQLGFKEVYYYTGNQKEWDELGVPPR